MGYLRKKEKEPQEGKQRQRKQGAVLHTDTGTCLLASSLILLTLGSSYLSRPMPPLTQLPLWLRSKDRGGKQACPLPAADRA